MTYPEFTPVVEQSYEKRDPGEYLPWKRCTRTAHREGKLLIVRPLKMIADFRPLTDDQKAKAARGEEVWRGDLCVADIACLDPIEPAFTELGEQLRGFPAGHQWREETIMLGYLNAAFKDYVGKTCIGTVYPQQTKYPQPAIRWQDLAGDETSVNRARKYLIAFPDFLIPRAAAIVPVVQQAPPQQGWGQPQGAPAPVSPAPQGWAQSPGDPWAQGAPQPVSPAPAHPSAGMSTIDQLKMAAQNAMGQQQDKDPPF